MPYRVAGIDVHKRMLAVAVVDVEVEGAWRFERRQLAPARANSGHWPSGSLSARSRKS